MSYWAEHPEVYTEIIFWEMVDREFCNDSDDPDEAVANFVNDPEFYKVAMKAEIDYWGNRMDDM